MDKHEYMIWRAITRYDLLHSSSVDATEENVDKMVDEKEEKITELIPNYFVGKDKYIYVSKCDNTFLPEVKKLRFTATFIASNEDYRSWKRSEMLCCYLFDGRGLSGIGDWRRYWLRSYNEVINKLCDSERYGNSFDHNNLDSIKRLLLDVGIYTMEQLANASVTFSCPFQITPKGEEIVVCTFLGEDCLKIGENLNE